MVTAAVGAGMTGTFAVHVSRTPAGVCRERVLRAFAAARTGRDPES